ncbi:MAG: bifunctional UDP-sugar hydrolase/5'-nucleotidase [Longicatena sp.]
MKNLKKLLLLLSISLFVFSTNIQYVKAEDKTPIKIVHTNDTHGRVYEGQDKSSNIGSKATIAGFDKVKAVANSTDTKYGGKKADFILDAGDSFHGLSFATVDKGNSIARIMGAVGYDALTPGNHDWNYGQQQLLALESIVKNNNPNFKLLAGNVEKNNVAFFGNNNSIIKDVNGIKVGVFGVSDPRIKSDVAPYNVAGLDFKDEIKYANDMVAELEKAKCNVVIALTHGLELETFAKNTKGIDVIVGGHEHQIFNKTLKNQNNKDVSIVETGYYFNNIGVLNLKYSSSTDSVEANETLVTPVQASAIVMDTEAQKVAALINTIKNEQATEKNKKIGDSSTTLLWDWPSVRIDEQPIGRLLSDAYLDVSKADISFENAGGIRAGLNAGVITKGNIIDISPFGNYIETRTMKGSDIKTVLERSIEIGRLSKIAYEKDPNGNDYPNNSGSYLQVGGLYVTYDLFEAMGSRIKEIKLMKADNSSVDFDENAQYVTAISNYLATSKDYPEFVQATKVAEYSTCEEAITQFVQKGDNTIQSSIQRVRLQNVSTPSVKSISLQYIADTGGYIEGNSKQEIVQGKDGSEVRAVANKGYCFNGWSDGVKSETRKDNKVTENKVIHATFIKESNDKQTTSIDTGDNTQVEVILVVMGSAIVVVGMTFYLKKRNNK